MFERLASNELNLPNQRDLLFTPLLESSLWHFPLPLTFYMKLSLFVAGVASVAADAEPPVISLNFDAKSDFTKIMKLKNSVVRSHDLGYKNNGVQVGSRQDWVERCPAGRSTKASCPFPKASAFDHNDGKVFVTKRIYLVDQVKILCISQ